MIIVQSISRFSIGGALAVLLLAAPVTDAAAAGAYDGSWVIDFPAAGLNAAAGQYDCPAVRLVVQIANNQISGTLGRIASGSGTELQSGQGSPVTGSVRDDGSMSAEWQNYSAEGTLSESGGQVTTVRDNAAPAKGSRHAFGNDDFGVAAGLGLA